MPFSLAAAGHLQILRELFAKVTVPYEVVQEIEAGGRSRGTPHRILPTCRQNTCHMLTVVDQWSRESVLIEPAFSFSGAKVAEVLERIVINSGSPLSITIDHGTEFTSIALEERAYRRGIKLD